VQTNIGLSVLDDHLLTLLAASLEEVGSGSEGVIAAPRWTVVPPSIDGPRRRRRDR
jgi:hypothetical protein